MLSLVIQAGGKSSRMGSDKALKPFLGHSLIEHVLQRVIHLADEVLITTNFADGYRFLSIPLVPDIIPGRGALGGLYTALEAARHPLVSALTNANIDAAIPQTENGLEPLHAIYRRSTCLPAVKAAIEADQWRLSSWHHAVNVHVIGQSEILSCDPDGLAFFNLNTPDAFQEAEIKARLTNQ